MPPLHKSELHQRIDEVQVSRSTVSKLDRYGVNAIPVQLARGPAKSVYSHLTPQYGLLWREATAEPP